MTIKKIYMIQQEQKMDSFEWEVKRKKKKNWIMKFW